MKNSLLCVLILFGLLPLKNIQAQKQAFLIIDIQDFYFPGGKVPLEGVEEAAVNAGRLLEYFRGTDQMVVHVRHNFEPGGAIHSKVKPEGQEVVISKDHVNAFLGTDLDSILQMGDVDHLVICGMQTHMCLEAAVRAASDLGYHCVVVEDACATRALQYDATLVPAEQVHKSTLRTLEGSYARITRTRDFLQNPHKTKTLEKY